MPRRLRAPSCCAGLVLGVAIPLIGCGKAQSDSSQVRSVVEGYFAAIEHHDGSGACSLFTAAAKEEVMRASQLVSIGQLHRAKALTCSEYLTAVFAELSAHRAAVERVKAVTVGTGGHTATARVSEPGESEGERPLTKTPDGWRIGTVTRGFTQQPHEAETGEPLAIAVQPPRTVAQAGGPRLAQFYIGRSVAAQSGCLACHRIGEAGNAGPGPDLTQVGARLPPLGIERSILNPTAPMPSFRRLAKAKLKALVTFLTLLGR